MATEVVMPQMGESIAEGTITKWLVKVGDRVERDQPLFEISTDKVDAEIPSPAGGTLLEIKHEEGETVEVDEVVAVIGEEGEEPQEAADRAAPEPQEAGEEEATAAEEGEEAAGEEEPPAEGEEPEEPEEPEEAAAEEEPEEEPEEAAAEEAEAPSEEERMRTFSSPVVRRIAEEEGVDLSEVEGTGAHGRVTKKDILAFLEEREETAEEAPAAEVEERAAEERKPAAAPPAPAAAESVAAAMLPGASPIPDFSVPAYREGDDVDIEPMSQIRKITAAHMIYSKHMSAHVTTAFEIDMSHVVRVRERAKRKFREVNGTKLTYMPFIFKATVDALKAHPKLNAAIDGENVVYKNEIHLGMAVAMEKGLLVPVIRNADRLSLVGLAETANDLADRARSKKLGPDELQGGTFTITNPGGFGTSFGTPVINQPQVGILGIGAFQKRPVVVTDEDGQDAIGIRTMAFITLTYDHRLVDGADGSYFLQDVQKSLETDHWPELEPYL